MSKIVQAVNAMISNPALITDVIPADSEIFFHYKDKYTWSISRDDDNIYHLFYYPGSPDVKELARFDDGWEHVDLVRYSDKDIGTKEAKATFSELYTLLKERVYGVNDVLDDIISGLDF